MKNNTWKLSYPGKLKQSKEKIIQDMKDINSFMKKVYSNNCIIVIFSPCDNHGEIAHKPVIHIYDNFLEANSMLNQEQYSDDKNISVIQYDLVHDKFLFIMLKTNDSRIYKRLNKRPVQKMFSEIEIESKIQFLFNKIETKVILHYTV